MTELKPCPFCGGDGERWNIVSTSKKYPLSWVKCRLCGATTASYSAQDKAVDAWNRRKNNET